LGSTFTALWVGDTNFELGWLVETPSCITLLIPQGIHSPEQIKDPLDLFSGKVMLSFSDGPT